MFKMHVNGNPSASLTLNNSTLTTKAVTCGPLSCTGSCTKPTQPTTATVYVGLASSTTARMEICCSSSPYIDFTTINNDFKGRMIYAHNDNRFSSQVGGSSTVSMNLLTIGLTVTGTVVSSDKRFTC